MSLDELPQEIKDYVVNEFDKNKFKPSKRGHISIKSLCGCLRKSWFRAIQPKDFDFNAKWNMWRGNLFDNIFTQLFKDNKGFVTHDVNEELQLRGVFDCIESDGALCDIKVAQFLPKKPRDMDVKQIKFYAIKRNIEKYRIRYISLSDHVYFEGLITESDKIGYLTKIEEEAKCLFDCIENNIPPYKSPIEKWECDKCDYSVECGDIEHKSKQTKLWSNDEL